jgi:ABC-type uncharacterized transport system substrate-binding protein
VSEIARREFITLLGGAAVAWPLAARAQHGDRVRRVGVLLNNVQADPEIQGQVTAFRQSLEQLGWVEGRNVQIELRFSGGDFQRLPQLAQELVALNPDVIFAGTTPVVRALQAKTRTIPIVFVYVSDPVGARVVASPRAAGRKHHRFAAVRGKYHRKMVGNAQRDIAPAWASSARRQSKGVHLRLFHALVEGGRSRARH